MYWIDPWKMNHKRAVLVVETDVKGKERRESREAEERRRGDKDECSGRARARGRGQ